jgi:hypothetical protein
MATTFCQSFSDKVLYLIFGRNLLKIVKLLSINFCPWITAVIRFRKSAPDENPISSGANLIKVTTWATRAHQQPQMEGRIISRSRDQCYSLLDIFDKKWTKKLLFFTRKNNNNNIGFPQKLRIFLQRSGQSCPKLWLNMDPDPWRNKPILRMRYCRPRPAVSGLLGISGKDGSDLLLYLIANFITILVWSVTALIY